MKVILFFLLISFNLNAQSILQKADSLLVLGDYQSALNVLENGNISYETLNKSGTIYQQIGNYTKAIKKFKESLSLQKSLKTQERLGKCYQKNNQSDNAILVLEKVLKSNNKNLLLKYYLAKLYKTKKEFKKAKTLFIDLINSDNNNPNYYYYLGSIYDNLKEKDSAKGNFLKAIKVDSTHFKSLYKLSKLYRKTAKDSSYLMIQKGLLLYPKSKLLNLLAAKYSFKDKKHLEAINYFNTIKLLNSDNKEILGIAYYYSKNYEKAKDYLYELIETRKYTSKTFFYLSLIFKAEKDYEKAIMYMKLSIQTETPQLTNYYYELGLIHQQATSFKKAIIVFEKALKEDAYNYKAHYQLALTCDSFYQDRNIALNYYEIYLDKFAHRNKQTTLYVKQRIREIKKLLSNKN